MRTSVTQFNVFAMKKCLWFVSPSRSDWNDVFETTFRISIIHLMPLKESFRLQSVTFSAGRQTPAFTYGTLKIWLHSEQNELKWNFELFRLFKWQLLYKKGQTPTDSSQHFDVSTITMHSGPFPQLSPSKKVPRVKALHMLTNNTIIAIVLLSHSAWLLKRCGSM